MFARPPEDLDQTSFAGFLPLTLGSHYTIVMKIIAFFLEQILSDFFKAVRGKVKCFP